MLLAAVAATCLCFSGLMMLLSVLGHTAQAVGGSGLAIMITMASLGGVLVPLVAMPEWMRAVSHFIPVKWAILALEGVIWRGFTLAEMLLPCGILVAVGVVSFAVGVRSLARRAF